MIALVLLIVKYVTVPSDREERACHLDWQHQIFLYLLKMGLQLTPGPCLKATLSAGCQQKLCNMAAW